MKKINYMWVIIGICFLVVMTSLGLCSSGRTLYLTAITSALGIPRGAFAFTDTFRYITTTIVNLYFGRLVQRFGTKKLICAGFLCLIVSVLLSSVATNLFVFYLASILLGIGFSWTSTTMVSTIINKWCHKNKGTITGATLAANGIGGAIAVQLLSPIIFKQNNPFGYRTAYRLVALILLVTLAVIILFFREQPKDSNSSQADISPKKHKAHGTGWVGMDFSSAVRKPYFYLGLISMFLTGVALQGISGIAVPHMYDIGISIEFVALLTSISSIFLTIAKFTTGFMYDRLGMRITMNICFTCAFLSIFALIILNNSPAGRIIAFIQNTVSSFALPLETVMLPLFAAELFGNKNFDKFVGVFVSASYAGFAIGYPFGNICHDILGNYKASFIIFSIMIIFVTVSMQYVLSAANRDKKIILAQKNSNSESVTVNTCSE